MKKVIITCFTLCLSLTGFTQVMPQKELHFNHLFVKDGLPEGTVTAIIQDREGYIWVGTQKGLVRYDGYKPKVYNLGFPDYSVLIISKIYQDSRGRLWVGTQKDGLYLYDRSNDRFVHCVIDSATASRAIISPLDFITDIHDDKDGNLWLIAFKFLGEKEKSTKHFVLFRYGPQTGNLNITG